MKILKYNFLFFLKFLFLFSISNSSEKALKREKILNEVEKVLSTLNEKDLEILEEKQLQESLDKLEEIIFNLKELNSTSFLSRIYEIYEKITYFKIKRNSALLGDFDSNFEEAKKILHSIKKDPCYKIYGKQLEKLPFFIENNYLNEFAKKMFLEMIDDYRKIFKKILQKTERIKINFSQKQ